MQDEKKEVTQVSVETEKAIHDAKIEHLAWTSSKNFWLGFCGSTHVVHLVCS